MGLTGDFDELQQLTDRLEELSSGNARRALAHNLAEEALELVHEGFEEGRDPEGNAWAPLQHRDGQTLVDRGTMRNSFHVADYSEDSFRIAAGVWYAVVHQEGKIIETEGTVLVRPKQARALNIPGVGFRAWARVPKPMVFRSHGQTVFASKVTIPARRMLPETGDLPSPWRASLEETAEEWLEDFFGT